MNIPKLRFPEFRESGDWGEKSISDLGEIITGNTPSTQERELYNGRWCFVSPADIASERYIKETKTTLSDLGFAKTRQIPPNSSLFVCIGSTIGKIAQNLWECATNQQINAVIPNLEYDQGFVYFNLEYNSSNIAELAGNQAVPIINKTTFGKYILKCPKNKSEQQKIADCLASLDELITAENEKLEALKEHKKGLMQNLFPQVGESVPRLRFPEFKDEGGWEEKELSKIINTITPPKKIPTTEYQKHGKFPIIDQSKEAIAGWSDDDKALINKKLPIIVFGDHTCILKLVKQVFIQGADGIKIFEGNNPLDTEYLFYFLEGNPLKTEEYKRHFSILKEKMIMYPKNKSEQRKIADCFSSLDDLISAENQKLETLKEHKKGLMQNLFPNAKEKS